MPQDKQTKNTDIFNTVTAADYLGLASATLEAWRCRGGGPVFIKLGKAVRYQKKSLDTFINNRVCTSTSQEKG
ncbi:MAG: hypothetical protein C0392_04910 [Syntrophus sp. (in: bacteria)]|nr:hypothetical protein [Syntrophus sp. (in: bacteria)]